MKLVDFDFEINPNRIIRELQKEFPQICYSDTINSADTGFQILNGAAVLNLMELDEKTLKLFLLLLKMMSEKGYYIRVDGIYEDELYDNIKDIIKISKNEFWDSLLILEEKFILYCKYEHKIYITSPYAVAGFRLFNNVKNYEKSTFFMYRREQKPEDNVDVPDEIASDSHKRKRRTKDLPERIRRNFRLTLEVKESWDSFCDSVEDKSAIELTDEAINNFIDKYTGKKLDIDTIPKSIKLVEKTIRYNKSTHDRLMEFIVDHKDDGFQQFEIFNAILTQYMI